MEAVLKRALALDRSLHTVVMVEMVETVVLETLSCIVLAALRSFHGELGPAGSAATAWRSELSAWQAMEEEIAECC
jgi:hypothetical protein